MSEPRPLASLTASLLARKGDARPAIRRAYVPMASLPAAHDALHDDLGWNDMGDDAPPSAPVPAVVEQRERLARSFASTDGPSVNTAIVPRATRAAFTLRLDSERHLRLRLASAVANRSAQQIVTAALDAFLDRQPALDALVAQAKNAGGD